VVIVTTRSVGCRLAVAAEHQAQAKLVAMDSWSRYPSRTGTSSNRKAICKLFFKRQLKASLPMKSDPEGEPSKIPPGKIPKNITRNEAPRCAMEAVFLNPLNS
jgi:hypothetical protein